MDFGKILILGSGGQLGTEFQRSFGDCPDLEAYDRDRVDFTSEDSIRQLVRQVQPKIILNAAAYTAVNQAEKEPDLAMAINGTAPRILAEEAKKLDALFVHYSTDYVFDGSKSGPWVETDEPAPLNVYGKTKLAGERAVANEGNKYLIFRTSWVFSPHGNNFLLTMRKLAEERDRLTVVNDQYGAPTSAEALAKATRSILDKVWSGDLGPASTWAGLYHMTCSGTTTWYGFTKAILESYKKSTGKTLAEIEAISSENYTAGPSRPKNSILSNAKLFRMFGVQLPTWEEALCSVNQELEKRNN